MMFPVWGGDIPLAGLMVGRAKARPTSFQTAFNPLDKAALRQAKTQQSAVLTINGSCGHHRAKERPIPIALELAPKAQWRQ